ncbi:uncharacterized protein V1510DRAFT_134549 [Dipodascopsis tothii]|uniref:uncharacterized protein n=1 Tax=Dipodascopsis tothii TaxID=44089 RepID=UPI0034CEC183
MVRKTTRRVTYVLASESSHHGHTLGVNSLAVDPTATAGHSGTLYSAGRDGMVMAWNLDHMNLHPAYSAQNPFADPDEPPRAEPADAPRPASTFRTQVHMHTHWVNDIVLANNYQTLVSCSSDLTVKLWRPQSGQQATIGQHHDFVKCLAVHDQASDFVASGGLDRKVVLWDLAGAGQRLEIDIGHKGRNPKGSVYALGLGGPGGNLVGCGGPESIVRLFDARSGKSVNNFVGHTDNVRSILINKAGDLVLSASSDATVKLWSITAGRLVHTLNMHDSSVWSLHSDHPDLQVFLSSDRAGYVVRTDMRGAAEAENATCVLVCNEHQGVSKVVGAGDYFWTATSNSRIHRWRDVDTTGISPLATQQQLERRRRASSVTAGAKPSDKTLLKLAASAKRRSASIPPASIISLSGVDYGGAISDVDEALADLALADAPATVVDPAHPEPLRHNPDETIEGQTGLIKHILLNDRRRVLTVDTAGEVLLWDLIKCVPVKSFGGRSIQDVADEINTFETMANWCHVNTRTGQLAVVLEESYCFDAEIYADELESDGQGYQFREDQRINLGKWVLRNLFAGLIDAELIRDEMFRRQRRREISERATLRRKAPGELSFVPPIGTPDSYPSTPVQGGYPAHLHGSPFPVTTPGLSIGLATPAPIYNPNGAYGDAAALPPLDVGAFDKGPGSPAAPGVTDYFSSPLSHLPSPTAALSSPTHAHTASFSHALPPTETESQDADQPAASSSLMGKLRSFGKGKLSRTMSMDTRSDKPAPADAAADAASLAAATPAETGEDAPMYDDTLAGVIERTRKEYEAAGTYTSSSFVPSMPNDTPVLKIPSTTSVIISEQRVDTGGMVDLYRGSVSTCGADVDVDLLEQVVPGWLAEYLMLNRIPQKDLVKVSFVLQPYKDELPPLLNGNARLNAYRMLRAKKIISYVDEKLDNAAKPKQRQNLKEGDNPSLKPEDWLELVCQGQTVDNAFTLATIRALIWRAGGDLVLMYRRKL